MKIKIQSILASLLAVSLLTCSASAMTFPDVDSNSPYSKAIEYVSELGVMVGDSNGNFNPNNIVSRCEMATIVCRVLDETENLSKTNNDKTPFRHKVFILETHCGREFMQDTMIVHKNQLFDQLRTTE